MRDAVRDVAQGSSALYLRRAINSIEPLQHRTPTALNMDTIRFNATMLTKTGYKWRFLARAARLPTMGTKECAVLHKGLGACHIRNTNSRHAMNTHVWRLLSSSSVLKASEVAFLGLGNMLPNMGSKECALVFSQRGACHIKKYTSWHAEDVHKGTLL